MWVTCGWRAVRWGLVDSYVTEYCRIGRWSLWCARYVTAGCGRYGCFCIGLGAEMEELVNVSFVRGR